jgi:hypothetical protein
LLFRISNTTAGIAAEETGICPVRVLVISETIELVVVVLSLRVEHMEVVVGLLASRPLKNDVSVHEDLVTDVTDAVLIYIYLVWIRDLFTIVAGVAHTIAVRVSL